MVDRKTVARWISYVQAGKTETSNAILMRVPRRKIARGWGPGHIKILVCREMYLSDSANEKNSFILCRATRHVGIDNEQLRKTLN